MGKSSYPPVTRAERLRLEHLIGVEQIVAIGGITVEQVTEGLSAADGNSAQTDSISEEGWYALTIYTTIDKTPDAERVRRHELHHNIASGLKFLTLEGGRS